MESYVPLPTTLNQTAMRDPPAAGSDEQANVDLGQNYGLPPLSVSLKKVKYEELHPLVAVVLDIKKRLENKGPRTRTRVPDWFPVFEVPVKKRRLSPGKYRARTSVAYRKEKEQYRAVKYRGRAQKINKQESSLVLAAALHSHRNDPEGLEALEAGITEHFDEPSRCSSELFRDTIAAHLAALKGALPGRQPDTYGSPLPRPSAALLENDPSAVGAGSWEPGAEAASAFAEYVFLQEAPNGSLGQESASPAFGPPLVTSPVALRSLDDSPPPQLGTDSTSFFEDFDGWYDSSSLPERPQPQSRPESPFAAEVGGRLGAGAVREQVAPIGDVTQLGGEQAVERLGNGDLRAQSERGICCFVPMRGASYDEKEAFKCFKAAKEEVPRACALLAFCYYYGVGVAVNQEMGVQCAQEVPQEPVAMFILGVAHVDGSGGVEKDLGKANEWFKDATEGLEALSWAPDDPLTQQLLGLCYLNGHGTRDTSVGLDLIREAADQGAVLACALLGDYYFRQEGQGSETAFQYLLKAAEAGYAGAQLALAKRFPHRIDALAYLKSVANKGLAEGQYELGKRYVEGIGVEEDLDQGRSWLGRAAAQSHRKAGVLLATLDEEYRSFIFAFQRELFVGAG